VGLYTELFYAIIPTLFPSFLLICYPYILYIFNAVLVLLYYCYFNTGPARCHVQSGPVWVIVSLPFNIFALVYVTF